MSDRLCPCGARLDRSSEVSSLASPFFRMFMSIRTMKSLVGGATVRSVAESLDAAVTFHQ